MEKLCCIKDVTSRKDTIINIENETAMILTKNRRIILALLDSRNDYLFNEISEEAPYTCQHIYEYLFYAVKNNNSKQYDRVCSVDGIVIEKSPSIKQVERTLRNLVSAGLVHVTQKKSHVIGSMKCDKWVNHYELASQAEENAQWEEIYKRNCQLRENVAEIKKKLNHTYELYSLGKEVIKEEFDSLMKSLKKTLGQLHPDKLDGDNSFCNEFSDLKKIQDQFKKLDFVFI